MIIRPIHSKADLGKFLDLPYRFYHSDPMWVPPLRSDQRSQFDPQHNPLLDHCDWQHFLLIENGEAIGRVTAFIDRLAMEAWKEPIGFFGYYECTQNQTASYMLLDAARNWLKEHGIHTMRGPWSFVSQEWGMVIEGFEPPPVVMAPFNPLYYNEQMTGFGLKKAKDLLCWYISGQEGYRIPERILKLTDAVAQRYDIHVRQIDMHRYEQEVALIVDLSNQFLDENWGYSPVTDAEVQALARDMKPVIHPKGVLFAEDREGRPIGLAIALPDVNVLLKGLNGRLFPFGWLKILRELPRLHSYRMFALGVIPEYQGKGIDSLIYRALYESLFTSDLWMEINYVLEDNIPMTNAIRKLNATPLRRYRVYDMEI
jgi:GNAT superfamily N-acetyltransferase